MDELLLVVAFAVVLGGALLFTNAVEWLGHRLGLGEGAVGSVLAAVGTATPETLIAVVALLSANAGSEEIAIGSSAQVALFVAPVLVLASIFVGPGPLALVFNGFELGALLLAVLIANYVTQDGESTWFEGVQLLAVYLVFGIAFYYA